MVVLGCGDGREPTEHLAFGEWHGAAAASDPSGAECDDVGGRRVCWGSDTPSSHAAVRPPGPAPADARWRCEGSGRERRCRLERRRPFSCESGMCVQRAPRLPDDGEWECADVDGLVVCRGRSAPAGVVAAPGEAGWICGDTASESEPVMRICVDLVPDHPSDLEGAPDCRFRYEPSIERTCTSGERVLLARACGADDRCPRGMTCVQDACVPRFRPRPDCWTDRDCEGGQTCVLATCIAPG